MVDSPRPFAGSALVLSSSDSVDFDFTTYTPGALEPQGGWIQNSEAASGSNIGDILGNQYASSAGLTNCGDMHNPAFIGFDSSLPFTLTATTIFAPTADLGGTLTIILGTNASASMAIQLQYSPGDGALNQITDTDLSTNTTDDNSGVIASTAGVNHQIIVQYDGTDLKFYYDAVLITTRPAATMVSRSSLRFWFKPNDASDLYGINEITLSQP